MGDPSHTKGRACCSRLLVWGSSRRSASILSTWWVTDLCVACEEHFPKDCALCLGAWTQSTGLVASDKRHVEAARISRFRSSAFNGEKTTVPSFPFASCFHCYLLLANLILGRSVVRACASVGIRLYCCMLRTSTEARPRHDRSVFIEAGCYNLQQTGNGWMTCRNWVFCSAPCC